MGDFVGALLGEAVGAGVGFARVVVKVTVSPLVTVKALFNVTVVDDVTDVTVALEEPTATIEPVDTPAVEATVTVVDVLESVAVDTNTSPTVMYVGDKVGSTVGALLGEALGLGVGTLLV